MRHAPHRAARPDAGRAPRAAPTRGRVRRRSSRGRNQHRVEMPGSEPRPNGIGLRGAAGRGVAELTAQDEEGCAVQQQLAPAGLVSKPGRIGRSGLHRRHGERQGGERAERTAGAPASSLRDAGSSHRKGHRSAHLAKLPRLSNDSAVNAVAAVTWFAHNVRGAGRLRPAADEGRIGRLRAAVAVLLFAQPARCGAAAAERGLSGWAIRLERRRRGC